MEDTIAAISTALGVGAIAIIRVSGPEAISIVNKIFQGKDLSTCPSHTIHYGHVIEKETLVDEVLVSLMRAPKTFTREDVVEINCHGGIAATHRILRLVLENGCRLADPGEFTKRAFLNGRIDLLEAEGIMDLIEAKTDKYRELAMNQVGGKISHLIHALRQKILDVLANIMVNIDYPEYEDIEEYTISQLRQNIQYIKIEVQKILQESENGRVIKEGIKVVILGRPNVGKSSLLNAILEEDKAIVTEIEGTTRDIVEGTQMIDGVLFHFIDTAGIREAENIVEKIGVAKSLALMEEAELILYVLNQNEPLQEEDQVLLDKIGQKKSILVLNKTDLTSKLDLSLLPNLPMVKISASKKEGMDQLKSQMSLLFHLEELNTADPTYLTNARSLAILKEVENAIGDVEDGLNQGMPIDMLEIDLKKIWDLLGTILGETYQEELIDELFRQFCLGK